MQGTGARVQAWWIEGGGETCGHCLQRYAYEVEYRCAACDGPVCPLCVVRVRATGESFCPDCAPAAATDASAPGAARSRGQARERRGARDAPTRSG